MTIDTANDDASINLLDNDSATVSIAATTAAAAETGSVAGQFTVTQTAASGSDTEISYTVAGTASNGGVDYTSLSGTVTIAAGTTAPATALIDVSGIVDDGLVEGDETVIVTLTGITSGDPEITIDAANDDATVTIADNDSATVSIAGTTAGNETGPANGVFTVTQTVISDGDTVLTYSVAGTADSGDDFTALGGSVTIAANSTTATITVPVTDDALVEGTETVIVTLTGITTGEAGVTIDTANDDASINITDNDSATVSIAGTTAGNETGPVNGVLTVTQTVISDGDTVLTYSVAGTATSGDDYTALSGSVTIAAGATTATITVPVLDDALVEGTETVAITLTGITAEPGVTIDAGADNASINITDNDSATVSIAGTTAGNETGPANGVFTVTQTVISDGDTVLTYSVAGTADSGDDFTALGGSVTIAANSTTATITVPVTDDALVEGTETVIVTLTGITTGEAGVTIDTANDDASINITDNDSATVSIAGTTAGNETGPANGVLTVTQTVISDGDTVLTYSVAGTATSGDDFTALSGTVTIPANTLTATITVPVLDDALVEGTETVAITLTGITAEPGVTLDAGADNASINITDNDSATVSIGGTTAGNETGPVNGVLTVTQTVISDGDTVLTYSVAGTATSGDDFTALSGTVTIPANTLTATITVPVLDDALVEGTETVAITLTGITAEPGVTIDAGADNASINITDNDSATVSIGGTTAGNEAGGPVDGVFTVTQTVISDGDTVLTYSVAGTATSGDDYTALGLSVTILAGQTTATITVPVLDDALVEGTETVAITLTGITAEPGVTLDAGADNASINITDNDSATVSIGGTTAGNEAGGPVDGVFTVTQTVISDGDTVLTYSVAGTATSGADYTALSGTVTIAAGATTATITVPVLDDALVEGTETVALTLTGITAEPGVTIDAGADNASINIADNDSATVSIAGTTAGNETGPVNGVLTVTQTVISDGDTVLTYSVAGTATSGDDYTALGLSVTILAGQTTATIAVPVLDDALVEGTETVALTLTGITAEPGVTIDAGADNASINIADNDSATVSIAGTTAGNETGPVNGVLTVTQTVISDGDTVLTYSVAGTATSGADYTALEWHA